MFELENYLKEIYQTDNINICTENNDLLCPNIKLIELILLNPQKFKKLKIVNNIYIKLIIIIIYMFLQQQVKLQKLLQQKKFILIIRK